MRRRNQHPRGFTIIELLVVLVIAAGLMGLGVSMLNILSHSALKDESMRLTSVIKYTYHQAALNNAQYRLVLDLDQGTYHTEVTESPVVPKMIDLESSEGMLPEEAQELEKQYRAKHDLFNERENDPFGMHQRKPSYQRISDGEVEPRSLPDGIRIIRVVTAYQRRPFESGRAAVSFFPNGFQQHVMIYLGDEHGGVSTLVTEPLTGRVRIYSRELDVPSNFGEEEYDD
ncbi:MAG: Tfp pilus assembly protein FimT/FimU [Bradymonadaceae bacterium]